MRPRTFPALPVLLLMLASCASVPAAQTPPLDPSPSTSPTNETAAAGSPSASRPAAPSASGQPSTSPAAGASALASPGSPAVDPSDVLTYRGNVGRTGVMPGPGPSGKAAVRWTFDAGGPITSQVAVANKTVYVVSGDGTLHAVDLASGSERWRSAIGAESDGSPTITGGLVIAPALHGAHALSAVDGKRVWDSSAPGPARGTPAVVNGTAVFAAGGIATAVDVATGAVRWTVPMEGRDDSSVAAADGVVVLGDENGVVLALALADGSRRWRVDFGDYARLGTPVIAGGRVFLASLDGGDAGTRHITALDLATGTTLWRFASPGDKPSYSPAIVGGLAITEGEDGSVTALDASTGRVKWQSRAPGGLVEVVPAVSAGVVYGASNYGDAFALDARTGAERWRVPITGVPYGAAVTSGLVLVGTDAGTLYAIGGGG